MNKREAVKKAIVMATIDSLLMEGSNTVYVWACHDHVDYVGPTHLGKDGYTQLDISNRAVRNFTYGKTALEFSTTYSGKGLKWSFHIAPSLLCMILHNPIWDS